MKQNAERAAGGNIFRKYGKEILFAALCVLWIAFIFSNSLKSGAESSKDSLRLLQWCRKIFPSLSEHFLRKAAHFSEFAVLGVLLGAEREIHRKRDVRYAKFPRLLFFIAPGALIGAADELIQCFSPSRSPMFTDVCIDFAGFMTGFAAVLLLFLIIRRCSHGSRQ